MDGRASGFIVLLLVSLVPGILWVWFFYRKDRAEPEPKPLVMKAFLYGAISVLPAAFIEAPFRQFITGRAPDLLTLLVISVLVVGLVEETSKFVAMHVAAFNSHEFNEVMDGVVYGVAAGLGFAAVENLFYSARFGIAIGAFRAFITDLAHASFSGIAGYYLGRAKFDRGHAAALIARGMITAILLHGLYDFLIIAGLVPPAFGIVMVLATYAYLNTKIVKARRASPFRRTEGPSGVAGGGLPNTALRDAEVPARAMMHMIPEESDETGPRPRQSE